MAWTTPETAVAGQVLTAAWLNQNLRDNTQYLKDQADVMGLIYITNASATSGTSLSVNNCFSADYENYLIAGYGVTTANYQTLSLRMRASGTDNSAGYYWGQGGARSNGGDYSSGAANTTEWRLPQVSIADRNGFAVTIMKPYLATRTQYNGHGNGQDITSEYAVTSGGSHNNTGVYDGFSLITGTITELKVWVYGYRIS